MNNEQNDLAETLRMIACGSRRSKIVRLREIFDLVEEAKDKGASNKEIVAGLKEHGLIFDVPNFKNARSRILKERAMEALKKNVPAITESEPTRPHLTQVGFAKSFAPGEPAAFKKQNIEIGRAHV